MSLIGKRPKLSKGLLEMKFMKRSKIKQMEEESVAEGRSMYESDITEGMKSGMDKFIIDPSFVRCENLRVGRFSYGGMNPYIERLMEEEAACNKPPLSKEAKMEQYADVPAEEMQVKRVAIVDTVARKFNKKKKKFLKPKED